MLSSIILSLVMNTAPVVIDTKAIEVDVVGQSRGTRRLSTNNKLDVKVIGQSRGTRRLNSNNSLNIKVAGQSRGTRRL